MPDDGEEQGPVQERSADEILKIFQTFDRDKNGSINGSEISTMLRSLDASKWGEQSTSKLMAAMDTDSDGEITLTEFWHWINGAGGKGGDDVDFDRLVNEDERKRSAEKSRLSEAQQRQEAEQRALLEKKAQKKSHDEFVKNAASVGVTRGVTEALYKAADQDGDGFVDAQELSAYRRYELASVQQVKEVFRTTAAPEDGALAKDNVDDAAVEELVDMFDKWDVDGDGHISQEELGRVLLTLNPMMTKEAVDGVMKAADADTDGYIDVYEFVDWLCGDDKKKKKAAKKKKETMERVARVSAGLFRQRAEEARNCGKQAEFEKKHLAQLAVWCKAKKWKKSCQTLNSPGDSLCLECNMKHAWLCLGCGFVSYFEDCVNDCPKGQFGWVCVLGKCKKGKCGCKKPISFHRKKGFAMDPKELGARIEASDDED